MSKLEDVAREEHNSKLLSVLLWKAKIKSLKKIRARINHQSQRIKTMTPQHKIANLALMCKSKNYRYDNPNQIRVGNWVIAEARRQELLGATVILTESQVAPAYLGGRITGFNPTPEGKVEVIFKEDKSLVGNDDAVGHNGWGSGRGVCYV